MAIEKNYLKVSRFDPEYSSHSRDSMSSDDEVRRRTYVVDSDDEFDDADSGAGSDDFELLELGETMAEFCQVGNQTCSVPLELYDLADLSEVLSLDVWNECLSEEERFGLTKFLPDMDQGMFMRTLKELFTGCNFHFGSPVSKMFAMLKGGKCEPRVALYRQGLEFFQKRQHYHLLRKHQNNMVSNLYQIRVAWSNCRGYSIEEKLRLWNIMKNEKGLMHAKTEDIGVDSDSSGKEESGEGLWNQRLMDRKVGKKFGRNHVPAISPTLDFPSLRSPAALESTSYGKQNPKSTVKLAGIKTLSEKELVGHFPSSNHGFDKAPGYHSGAALRMKDRIRGDNAEDNFYQVTVQKDRNVSRDGTMDKAGFLKKGKKHEYLKGDEFGLDSLTGVPMSFNNDLQACGRNKNVNQLSDIEVLTAKPSSRAGYDFVRKTNFPETMQQYMFEDKMKSIKGRLPQLPPIGNHSLLTNRSEPFWKQKSPGEAFSPDSSYQNDEWNVTRKKWKSTGRDSPDLKLNSRAYSPQLNDRLLHPEFRAKSSHEKIRGKPKSKGGPDMEAHQRVHKFAKSEETESDSSEQPDEEDDNNSLMRNKSVYSTGAFGSSQSPFLSSGMDHKNNKYVKFPKKPQSTQSYINGQDERLDAMLMSCNTATKKRKGKEGVTYSKGRDDYDHLKSVPQQHIVDSHPPMKHERMKVEADTGSVDWGTSEPPVPEAEVTDDPELEAKPQKKTFTLITPTIHTGFSFSIIHLLSSVRMALTTPNLEDSLEQSKKNEGVSGVDSNDNVPSLTVQETVNRVRSNPGDPCILETQEPLQDLVRGVLKILLSKSAPLGAKGWKPLVSYEKTTKSWSWIGPASQSSLDHEIIEEITSPEAWGLPYKMLVKLVDSFANWLKSGQETLQQIGSLPAPPASLMQFNLEEKDRFKDLRAQKSLNTISPSSEEVRNYFRREEVLRYSIPDRAFSYTAADGKKAIVAPLRRCGGKPTSKARDHFMLKRDRPPHVTILCLVRDAAARLPGSIGTRADVCTLIRDSQYIVEDVSDAQVNQVVSGALDRLHYERDPCVQFDSERKLWVYLHREREEEDFEDDGTSSTKKWKRQKKDGTEQLENAVTVAFRATGEQSGFDICSDLNVEPSFMEEDKEVASGYGDVRQNMEENIESSKGGQSMVWESLGLNPKPENILLCPENSTNEDFDDENFAREKPVGIYSASVL